MAYRMEVGAAALCALVFAASSQATILTFDQIRLSGTIVPAISGNAVPADYGDNVTGSPMAAPGGFFTYGEAGEGFTPNVTASYASGIASSLSIWQDAYGDLTNNLFGGNNSLSMSVQLAADPGFDVLLYAFDLAGWPSADYTIAGVEVLSGAVAVFSQANVPVEGDANGPPRTPFVFGTPLAAPELTIRVDYSNLAGAQQDNIGLDNIRFGQNPPPPSTVIPEPSSVWLLLAGIGWAAVRQRSAARARAGSRRQPRLGRAVD